MPWRQTLRVLIVEDDKFMSEALRRKIELILKNFPSARVTCVGTLAAAIRTTQEYPEQDLILLDLNLPDSKWEETLAQVQIFDDHAPVIIITGLNRDKVLTLLTNRSIEVITKDENMWTAIIGAMVRAITRKEQREAAMIRSKLDYLHRISDILEVMTPDAPDGQ